MDLLIRGLIGVAFAVTLWVAGIFIPTWIIQGNLDWSRGWEFIIFLSALYLIGTLWLLRTDPDLLKERTSMSGNQPIADKLASLIIILFLACALLFVPIDVHKLHHLPKLPEGLSYWGGYILLLAGCFLFWKTMSANTFAATIVKDQAGRGQKVIDTSVYAFVRHPMYLGIAIFLAGYGLFLESTFSALIAFPSVILCFLPRILIEEATLKKDLPGYTDYMSRVRWRILPLIF